MASPWWVTDSLDKVFPDSALPIDAPKAIELWAARNETEDAQVAIAVPEDKRVNKAAFSFSALKGPRGHSISPSSCRAFWEWYVWVHANPPANTDPSTYLRKAPAFFPDAFLEEPEPGLRGGVTQPLWVSVQVPEDAAPGDYRGTLTITMDFRYGSTETIKVPVVVHVWPFSQPSVPTMHQTEWFDTGALADWYHIAPWSEPHWEWIEKVARDMAAHKQDMIGTHLPELVGVTRLRSGSLDFDFRRFDRWVDIFTGAGINWIEGMHVAGRTGDWTSQIALHRWRPRDESGNKIDTSRKKMSDRQFAFYVEGLLKAVYGRLKARGLGNTFVQHVADEPIPANEASWKAIASQVKRWIPAVRRIDAIESEGLRGYCDIQVPQIQEIHNRSNRRYPEELWSYVCLFPQTIYPNRFLDYPSVRHRMIWWLSYSLNLKGFLHWAYSAWRVWSGVPMDVPISPWTDLTGGSLYNVDTQPLPAGDTHIVYPGRHSICSSIRWEVIRKGYEDHALLTMLDAACRRPKRKSASALLPARALLAQIRGDIARDPARHTRNPVVMLNVRRAAGDLLSRL